MTLDMRVMQDCAAADEDKGRAEAVNSSRRLSRSKTGLLLVDPVTVAVVLGAGAGVDAKLAENRRTPGPEQDADAGVVYGGGVPGVALDAERVELPEFTGARDGGYKVRPIVCVWLMDAEAGANVLHLFGSRATDVCGGGRGHALGTTRCGAVRRTRTASAYATRWPGMRTRLSSPSSTATVRKVPL
jgi:hypothetical protein